MHTNSPTSVGHNFEVGERIILCQFLWCKVIILFHVRCWMKVSKKTKGKTQGLDLHYFNPEKKIRVAALIETHTLIWLFNVVFEHHMNKLINIQSLDYLWVQSPTLSSSNVHTVFTSKRSIEAHGFWVRLTIRSR